MNTKLRNFFSLLIGAFAGSWSNMGVLKLGSHLIPAPKGVDISNVESIKSHIHLYEPKDFLFPFLAHSLGTFIAVWVFMLIAKTQFPIRFVIGFGCLFFIGGLSMVWMLPGAPMWFTILDLGLAYFPMAYLGYKASIKTVSVI